MTNLYLALLFALLALLLFLHLFADFLRRVRREAYERGRRDADNWWIGAEAASDQVSENRSATRKDFR